MLAPPAHADVDGGAPSDAGTAVPMPRPIDAAAFETLAPPPAPSPPPDLTLTEHQRHAVDDDVAGAAADRIGARAAPTDHETPVVLAGDHRRRRRRVARRHGALEPEHRTPRMPIRLRVPEMTRSPTVAARPVPFRGLILAALLAAFSAACTKHGLARVARRARLRPARRAGRGIRLSAPGGRPASSTGPSAPRASASATTARGRTMPSP